jgi:two-component system chemotaxis sensor kinase CheA
VVLSSGSKQFGLIVEELFDIEEIVVKSLSDFFEDVHLFSGSTILGDGSIALIFDVVEISKMVGLDVSQSTTSAQEETAAVAEMQGQVLLFSLATPCMYGIPMAYVERLEQVETTSVDVVNDEWYLRYRGKILPLISCWQSMALKQPDPLPEEIDLVIYRHGVTEIGFVVNDIVDVVPLEGVLTKDVNVEPYILGSAIVQKKIVTMINLPHLAKSKFGKELLSEGKERLLVWDSDPTNDFKELKQKGYSVTAVHSIEEAEEAIRNVDVDVVLTESEIDDEDRDLINESLLEKYGPDKCIEIVSLTTEDSEGWQSQLDSDQLKGVLNDMLESQLKS